MLIVIGQVGGHAGFFVFGKACFVLPIGGFDFGFFHLFEGKPCGFVLGVVGHALQLAVYEAVHFAGLGFAYRANDVSAGLALYGFKAELCIVPHTILCRPLQQVVYRGIAATIVKVLGVKGICHHTAVEVEHLDVPVLSAVVLVGSLAHYVGIVFTRVAIAEHHVGVLHRTYAIGQFGIKTSACGFGQTELGGLVACRLGFVYQHKLAALHSRSLARIVGGHQIVMAAVGHHAPQLGLVRTVILTSLHTVAVVAHSLVVEGIDNAPRARKL